MVACALGALALHALAVLAPTGARPTPNVAVRDAAGAWLSIETFEGAGAAAERPGAPASRASAALPSAARLSPRTSHATSTGGEHAKLPRPPAPSAPREELGAEREPARDAPSDAWLTSVLPDVTAPSPSLPPRAARRSLLERDATADAEPPSSRSPSRGAARGGAEASSAARGTRGALASGGGGRGGRVTSEFPFGGPRGALMGEMCFVPRGTKRLRDVPHCSGGTVFFTDVLDVPERHFDSGFPGVTARHEWFSIRYSGTFTVQRAGAYRFRLESDDGSQLFIDGELVIDHDGIHPVASKRGEVALAAGSHEIVVRYFQGPRYTIALRLFVTPPGESERLFRPRL